MIGEILVVITLTKLIEGQFRAFFFVVVFLFCFLNLKTV